jgi:hypothetical protein
MTLRELMQFVVECAEQTGHSLSADCAEQIERQIAKTFPAEKVYIPRPDASKKIAIAEAAKRLPTDVVASRYGVTRSWVHKVVRKKVD